MTTNKAPENSLGGMSILSSMLTGPNGPQDLNDPIREPMNEPIIDDDDDDVSGISDFDEQDKDDPIVDPPVDDDDDDDVEPDIDVEEKPKKDSKSKSIDDDTEDLSEYSEDIAKYLKDELEANLGWDIPEDYEIKSVEDIVSFMKELTSEASKPKYANEEVRAYDEFVRNGGNLRDFYQSTMDGKIDTGTIELDNEFNQKLVLKEHLKNQGYNDAQIDRRLTRYDEAGVLEDEAADALEMLKEHNEKEKVKLLETQQKAAERMREEQLSFINNVEESVRGLDTIRGIKVSERDRQELLDYILKTDNSGTTQYQRDYMSNIGNLVESAYFTKNGQALVDKSIKQGKTEAYRSLHQKLKTNKGNKGKNNEGRDYGDNASSGLSLLGKQLLG